MVDSTRSATRKVPTRRVALDESFEAVPRHFALDGDLLQSHFTAALSALFPDGEDYFVRSVRHYRDRVTDPELKRQVAGFIGQEAIHGREHRAFNERLDRMGYHTRRIESLTKTLLEFRERVAPPIANLALTAALEHFTATLAELVLTDDQARESFGHQAVQDLFTWHALEESEHKSVAFDVYRAVGGSERLRIWTMKVIRVGFVVVVALEMLWSLASDPGTFRPRRFWSSWKRFRSSPVMARALREQLREYDRLGFHPDDRDTNALVDRWRERLFGQSGSMVDKLAGSPA